MNTQPQFTVPTAVESSRDTQYTISGAVTLDVAESTVDGGVDVGTARVMFIIGQMAESMTWDQQRRLGAALGYREVKERRRAPWSDSEGNAICEGDRVLRRQDGAAGIVKYMTEGPAGPLRVDEEKRWYVNYGTSPWSRLHSEACNVVVNGIASNTARQS